MPGKLHPQAAALLEGIFKPADPPIYPTVEGVRQASEAVTEALVGPGEPVARVWDSVAEENGFAIPLRWYLPTEDAPPLLTVYVHGGGWVTGTLDTYDTLCRSLALRSGGMVVNIDYSLSPETVFPRALDEVCLVMERARSLANEFGYAPDRIAVAGDSAGGQLIAAALHRFAERDMRPIDRAVFLYPVIDATMSHPGWERLADGYNLTALRMRWYWQQYAGESLEKNPSVPELSPLYSPHLDQFPRSLVVTTEFDLLSDEGRDFAERLADAGVTVDHLEVPGQLHGFLRLRKVLTDPEWGADAVMDRVGAFLRNA